MFCCFTCPLSCSRGGFSASTSSSCCPGFSSPHSFLEELERNSRLDFKAFYIRRARRLLPALLAVLVVTALLVLFFARDAATQFKQDVPAALTYTTNWWYVFDERSYFEVLGRPPMLLHLWSLAIEEQFYLIWPTAAFLTWRKWGRRGVGVVAVCGALVSTLWMSVLAVTSNAPAAADTARIYFGSDTHGMTVLAGAALAVVWRPSLLPKAIPGSAQIALTTLGTLSLARTRGLLHFREREHRLVVPRGIPCPRHRGRRSDCRQFPPRGPLWARDGQSHHGMDGDSVLRDLPVALAGVSW